MNSQARHPVPALRRSKLPEIVGWVEQALGEYETAFRWYERGLFFAGNEQRSSN